MKGRITPFPLRCFVPTDNVPTVAVAETTLRVVRPDDDEGVVRRPVPRRSRQRKAFRLPAEGHRVFMPQGYEPGYRYPLLVWLPDASRPADRNRFDLGRVMGRLSLRNFVAVEPSTVSGDPDHAIWESVEWASSVASVHPTRIFLIGVGTGGTTAFRFACRHAGELAGVVSLGGRFPLDEGSFGRLAEVRQLPMLLCTSRKDCRRQAPSIDRTLRVFHAAGATLAMRVYPASQPLQRAVLDDVNRWIMETILPSAVCQPSSTL
jgi:phospholipase/carboxylesterase